MELTPALAEYARKKLERVAKHFSAVIRAQVVLAVEKHRHIAEVVVHANGHHDFRAKEEASDLYAAMDEVAEMLHKHMARQKDKRVKSRRRAAPNETPWVIPVPKATDGNEAEPVVSKVRQLKLRSMTISEAAREMESKDLSFKVFLNDDVVSVLYRRKDKTYGLLEADL